MPRPKTAYKTIAKNQKFEVQVLDPKADRRDNVKLTLYGDPAGEVHHHLRAYEVMRLVAALQEAVAYGPAIPE